MKKVLTMTGATLGGAVGWWLGDKLGGTMTAFVLSMVATGVGVYAGIKVAQRYD